VKYFVFYKFQRHCVQDRAHVKPSDHRFLPTGTKPKLLNPFLHNNRARTEN
jgi:hypothetical protein